MAVRGRSWPSIGEISAVEKKSSLWQTYKKLLKMAIYGEFSHEKW
jgi:hypothetical protein